MAPLYPGRHPLRMAGAPHSVTLRAHIEAALALATTDLVRGPLLTARGNLGAEEGPLLDRAGLARALGVKPASLYHYLRARPWLAALGERHRDGNHPRWDWAEVQEEREKHD
jgi:hypothetical protein